MVFMTIWRWNNHNWDMSVMHTVIANTAKKSTAQGSHTTRTHYNQVRLFVFCQFTNHFPRPVAFFLVQFELLLKKKEKKRQLNLTVNVHVLTVHKKPLSNTFSSSFKRLHFVPKHSNSSLTCLSLFSTKFCHSS